MNSLTRATSSARRVRLPAYSGGRGLWLAGAMLLLPFLELRTNTPIRVRILLVLGIAANLLGVPFFGTMVWNVSVIIFGTLPLVAFLWLVLARNVRKLAQLDFLLAAAFLATRVI